MSEFDVRKDVAAEITSIRFSNYEVCGTTVASTLHKVDDRLHVRDADYGEGNAGYLVIANKSHAENLILALNKAISLGWL
jgi:hypothetical protein